MTNPELMRRATAPLAAAALLLAMAAPAAAETRADAGAADRSGDRGEQVTESEDGDGDPGLADAGDDAHPSGRDRSVEPGGSGNQGRAAHDPDGDANGGVDQPGNAGGEDVHDQDGNNGCGNDDDFEDDNRGRCQGRQRVDAGAEDESDVAPRRDVPDTPTPDDGRDEDERDEDDGSVVGGSEASPVPPAEVGGVVVDRSQPPVPARVPADEDEDVIDDVIDDADRAGEAEVMGVSVTRSLGALAPGASTGSADAASGELPRTGAGLLALAAFGAAVTGMGAVVTRLGRADGAA